MNLNSKLLDIERRFRHDGTQATLAELVECLDNCFCMVAFPIGHGMISHMTVTLNADYIAALGVTSTPPESTDKVVYAYHIKGEQWVGVPVGKLIGLTLTDEMSPPDDRDY